MEIPTDASRRATPRSAKPSEPGTNVHLPNRALLNTSVARTGEFLIKKL